MEGRLRACLPALSSGQGADKGVWCCCDCVVVLWLSPQVYLQCALLYTTTDGARRVRVSTLALPVSDQMGAVFKGADLDSQLAALTRQVSEEGRGGPVELAADSDQPKLNTCTTWAVHELGCDGLEIPFRPSPPDVLHPASPHPYTYNTHKQHPIYRLLSTCLAAPSSPPRRQSWAASQPYWRHTASTAQQAAVR